MPKYEKWLGASLGWVVTGSPLGGLLGYVAGRTLEPTEKKEYSKTANTSEFETNLIVLAAALIKAEGKATTDEITFVANFFKDHFDATHIEEKNAILNHCLSRDYDTRKACDELRITCSPSTRSQIVHFLFDLAITDRALAQQEADLIFVFAGWLNINDIEYRKIKANYIKDRSDKYQILGISSRASFEEIKTAYRKLVLEYHPDKNTHLSTTEQAKIAEQFRLIQEAFEKAKEERGN